jgi:hypothetical protein
VRKNKLDPEIIRELIGQGLSNIEIANRMGWTIGTLYVRCSQLKISLRRSSKKVRLKRWPKIPLPDDLFEQLPNAQKSCMSLRPSLRWLCSKRSPGMACMMQCSIEMTRT